VKDFKVYLPAKRGSAAPIKTAKEPFKNIGANHILVKEIFFIFLFGNSYEFLFCLLIFLKLDSY